MAFLDDIIGGAQRLSIGEKGGDAISVDASIREVHSVAGQVSEHPVESGVDIVDHYRVLPRVIEIEAVFSDTPITPIRNGVTLINSAIGLINQAGDDKDKGPSANAWRELKRFVNEAVVLEIKTSLETYQNMVLTDLTVGRSSNQAQGLFFTTTARELLFVTTEEGEALPASALGQKETSDGKKTNETSNDVEAEESRSLAKKVKNFFFD